MSKDFNSDKPRIGFRHLDGVEQIIASRWKIGAALAIAVLLCLSFLLLMPLADGIVLGLVFAYIARPLQIKFGKHRKLGAFVASLCIFVPIVFIIGVGTVEILNQISWIVDNKTAVVGAIVSFIRALNIPEELMGSFNDAIKNLFASLLPAVGSVGLIGYAQAISLFAINFIISIVFCFYILADGERLYCVFLGVMPKEYRGIVNRYACHLDLILGGVFIGTAYSALIISVTSVFVFYAFGFPHVLALATLIFIASVVPLFAGYMVLVPLALMRYIQSGFESAAIFFFVSSIVIYGPPELILRPYLTGMKSRIHPMLLILAFLGGAFVGGIAGFFAAPILLGALVAAYRVYQEYFHPELADTNLELKNMKYSFKAESEKQTQKVK
jgi:predicted PurR-regulated permease PerM